MWPKTIPLQSVRHREAKRLDTSGVNRHLNICTVNSILQQINHYYRMKSHHQVIKISFLGTEVLSFFFPTKCSEKHVATTWDYTVSKHCKNKHQSWQHTELWKRYHIHFIDYQTRPGWHSHIKKHTVSHWQNQSWIPDNLKGKRSTQVINSSIRT